jgi:4-hydroxy-4-methyl-2-oxoglutarate aldolase
MDIYSKEYMDSIQEKVYTAVICDILDDLGYRNQAMKGHIKPLGQDYTLVGIAKTILCYDVFELPEQPYSTEIEAVDSIKPGEVIVACTNNSKSNGFWGELMSTAAIVRGGRGAIIDGAVRDIKKMKALEDEFKVFASGSNPLDSKGRCFVAGYDCPLECDGVMVNPGDMVFGDIDGIVVVPKRLIEEVVNRSLIKVDSENLVRKELRQGKFLKEVYEKYQVL